MYQDSTEVKFSPRVMPICLLGEVPDVRSLHIQPNLDEFLLRVTLIGEWEGEPLQLDGGCERARFIVRGCSYMMSSFLGFRPLLHLSLFWTTRTFGLSPFGLPMIFGLSPFGLFWTTRIFGLSPLGLLKQTY